LAHLTYPLPVSLSTVMSFDILIRKPLVPTPMILGTCRLMHMKGVLMKHTSETTMGE
jgi:hypothetical protein